MAVGETVEFKITISYVLAIADKGSIVYGLTRTEQMTALGDQQERESK